MDDKLDGLENTKEAYARNIQIRDEWFALAVKELIDDAKGDSITINSEALWKLRFLSVCFQDRIHSYRVAMDAQPHAPIGRRLIGATSREKIAKEERMKAKAEIRAMLSSAGLKGAEIKHAGTNSLKMWALGSDSEHLDGTRK